MASEKKVPTEKAMAAAGAAPCTVDFAMAEDGSAPTTMSLAEPLRLSPCTINLASPKRQGSAASENTGSDPDDALLKLD